MKSAPNNGRFVPSIEQERLDQSFLVLKFRRRGLTYKKIGAHVPSTLVNGHGRLKTPHVRSASNTLSLFREAERRETEFAFMASLTNSIAWRAYASAKELEVRMGFWERCFGNDVHDAWLVAMDAQEDESWWSLQNLLRYRELDKSMGAERWSKWTTAMDLLISRSGSPGLGP